MQTKYLQLAIGVASLIIGIILLVRAHDMAHAFGDQVQQAFTGAPSNRATYFQIAGVLLTVFGVVYIILPLRSKS